MADDPNIPELRSPQERLEALQRSLEQQRTPDDIDIVEYVGASLQRSRNNVRLYGTLAREVIECVHETDPWRAQRKIRKATKHIHDACVHVRECPSCRRVFDDFVRDLDRTGDNLRDRGAR